MSTLAAAPARFGTARQVREENRPTDGSILHLILTYALVAILVFLAARGSFSFLFAPTANGGVDDGGGGGTIKDILVALAYGTVLLVTLPIYKKVFYSIQQNSSLLILPLWATLTFLWSTSSIRTIAAGVQVLILTLLAFYIMVRFTPRQQMQLFVATGVMATLFSFLVVVVMPSAGIDRKNSSVGLQGIYPQKNICAVITVELLVVGFCYAFRGRNAPLKRIGFIAFLTLLIIATTARTGWILCLLSVGFIALLKGLHRLRPLERFVVTWFLPALALVFCWVIYSNSLAILQFIGKDPSLSGRTGIWQVVFLSIVKRPLTGFGYGAFWIPSNPEVLRLSQAINDPGLSNAENGVLQLWLEIGLVGVIMLLVSLFRTCKNAVACFRSNTPNYAIWYMSILFITLLALVDGSKFMLWTSLDWMMYIMADIGLANEARRVRAARAA